MDIRYEVFTPAHWPVIEPALEALGVEAERLRAFMLEPQNRAFVALCGGAVCGFVYGYVLCSLSGAPQFFVYSVDVLAPYRGRGIGSGLFRFVVEYSREIGCCECFVITDRGNPAACRVYEKAGGKSDYADEIVYVIEHG